MRNTRLAFALLISVTAWCRAARAEDASHLSAAQQIEQAKAHFDRGQGLFGRGQFAAAALEFQAAYEFQPLALLLWNAAQAYRKAGDDGQALDYYKRYLEADPSTKKRADVEKTVAELEFRAKVASAAPPVETAPPRPQAGDTERPPLLAQSEPQRAIVPPKGPRPWWKDPLAPVLLGGGAALVAVGGGLWGVANAQVGGAGADYASFESAQSVGGTRIGGVVLVSIGAAALVAGAARYMLVWQRNRDRGETRSSGGAGARVSW